VALLVCLGLFLGVATVRAEHQLLPRFPEFVIEKGYSDAFRVESIVGSADLVNDRANSELTVVLTNVSERAINTSIKVRVLYLVAGRACQIWVDGNQVRFDRQNPRLPVNLQPNQKVTIKVAAEQETLYNLDAGKPKPAQGAKSEGDSKRFSLNDLQKMFNVEREERLGKRYLVGPLVTKWGVFPVEVRSLSLRIRTPHDFGVYMPTTEPSAWQLEDKGGNHRVFTCADAGRFAGAIFLPEKDRLAMPAPVAATAAATLR